MDKYAIQTMWGYCYLFVCLFVRYDAFIFIIVIIHIYFILINILYILYILSFYLFI